MKKAMLVVVMLALGASSARATIIGETILQPSNARIMQSGLTWSQDGGQTTRTSTDSTIRYDNWTTPPNNFTAIFAAGANEIADDVTMSAGGASLLDDLGINAGNANCAGTWSTAGSVLTVRFYNSLGVNILDNTGTFGGFTSNIPATTFANGASSRLSFGNGNLETLNWTLGNSAGGADPNKIFVSIQLTTSSAWPAGCSSANFGMSLRDGPSVGSSTDALQNVTGGTAFNFGGNPRANLSLKVVLDAVPEPGTLSLLALGAVGLLRRRK